MYYVQPEFQETYNYTCLQDTTGSVKLWEITRGVVVEDYGKVAYLSFCAFLCEYMILFFTGVPLTMWFIHDVKRTLLCVSFQGWCIAE